MKFRVFDTEGVGLNTSATKLHNLCYTEDGKNFSYTTSYREMVEWLSEPNVIWVGHYAIGHDMPAIKVVLGHDMSYQQFWDTLAGSWFLSPDRGSHGLNAIGKEHGFKKVVVEEHQWAEGDPVLMKERVIEDVKINWAEFQRQSKRLCEIYGTTEVNEEILRFIRYLSFKIDCLREQEASPLVVDLEKAQRHYDELEAIKQEKTEALAKVMPKVPVCSYRNKPKVMTKQDGSMSALAEKWYQLLKEQHLPSTTEGTVTVIEGHEDGNPNSPSQVKEWLYSLGWKPCTYKFDRNKATGEEKKIEQVRYSSPSDPRKGMLTDSVLKLKAKEQGIEHLEGLTVASHRMSIFKGFLESATPLKSNPRYGHVVAGAGGFTNTLRLKHRAPIVNLPKVGSAWGEEIRGCIVAPEGHTVCGADVVSLEDMTKRHYMKPLDPNYVEEMDVEGFDPHVRLLVVAGKITQEDYDFFVDCQLNGTEGKDQEHYKRLKAMRGPAKVTNYSSLYGVGAAKLAREAGMTVAEAKALIEAFWDMNWAIKQVSKEAYIKTLKDGSLWVKNPVSGFYYSLRYEKDIWSTLNQGTGVFTVDSWIMRMRKKGVVVSMQYHDEVLVYAEKGKEEETTKLLQEAMREVNETLKLNVEITSDVQYGPDYASVH